MENKRKIGIKILNTLRATGYRFWNGNCEKLNPEDEADVAEIIEREIHLQELISTLAELYEKTLNLAEYVVPLPVEKSHLIYEAVEATHKAEKLLEILKENNR